MYFPVGEKKNTLAILIKHLHPSPIEFTHKDVPVIDQRNKVSLREITRSGAFHVFL
jgi:hypothetical protein